MYVYSVPAGAQLSQRSRALPRLHSQSTAAHVRVNLTSGAFRCLAEDTECEVDPHTTECLGGQDPDDSHSENPDSPGHVARGANASCPDSAQMTSAGTVTCQ